VSVTDWRNISRLVSVICEKCSKRYPWNKFSRNFPSYTRKGPLGESLLLLLRLFSLSLNFSRFCDPSIQASGEKEREIERYTRRHPWKDDRVGPLAIISLATTRQMSDYCEMRRLVGRFSSFFRSCCYGSSNDVLRQEHNNYVERLYVGSKLIRIISNQTKQMGRTRYINSIYIVSK